MFLKQTFETFKIPQNAIKKTFKLNIFQLQNDIPNFFQV